ncbi:MAG: hypothetical protein K2Q22_12305 [Cytophagales bacterium]|nr:hypothetical protein [Cytophagales bacterium]
MPRYWLAITFLIILSSVMFSQGQSSQLLDSLNGYKEYKLGAELRTDSNKTTCSDFFLEIDELKRTTKSPGYASICLTPKNASIGDLKVLNIHITTYKSKIIRVIVNTEPGEKMAMIIHELLGNSSECDNFVDSDPILRRSETCIWKGKNVVAKFCHYFPMKGPVASKIPEPWMQAGFNSLTFTSPALFQQIVSEAKLEAKSAKKDF